MTRELQTFLKTTLLLLFLATASLQAGSMSAQEALNKATQYEDQNNYREALKWYKISYEIEPTDQTAFNLAVAYKNVEDYPNAIKYYKEASKKGFTKATVNLGLLYKKKLKDYPNAIKWYKKAYKSDNSTGALYLALLYDETLKDYPKAIEWYKKAYAMGNQDAAFDLGVLYELTLKDYPNAIEWYKKGVPNKYYNSIKNLGNLYYKQDHKLKATAYMIGLLSIKPFKRNKLFNYLKTNWKIDHKTLLKAYQLQKKLIPDPYTDPIFEKELHPNQSNTSKQEEEPTHHRHGRR